MLFCVPRKRGRTPARSIDAALLVGVYTHNCDYLMINAVSLISMAAPRHVRPATLLRGRDPNPPAMSLIAFAAVAKARQASEGQAYGTQSRQG
jgi:hypothetical protein